MKQLHWIILILCFATSCKQNSGYGDDKFLTSELDSLKSQFFRMYQGDQVRYTPYYNSLNYLDLELQKIGSTVDSGKDITMQLMKFKNIFNNEGALPPSDRLNQLNELDYLIEKSSSLDKSVLKHRLQLIEFTYWVSYMKAQSRHMLVSDRIQVYQTNTYVNSNGQFSTLVIPVPENTTHLYEINVGDSIKRNKLLGVVDKLKIDYDTIYGEHFSNYSTSKINYGLNKRPAQLVTIQHDGRADTTNFKIEFHSK